MRTRTDYACSGSEDEVTREVSCEGLLPRLGKGCGDRSLVGTKIAVTRVIPQRVTLGMGQGMRLQLELRYI